jgi:heat shock protein HslJ
MLPGLFRVTSRADALRPGRRPAHARSMARAVLLLTVLLLAGCAAASGGGSPVPDVVGEWELVSGTSAGSPLPQPDGARAMLTFDGADATGQSFCNHYGSTYSLDGEALRFDGIGGTEMACEPEIMAAETAYVTALAAVTTAARDGDDLLLTGDDVELRFRPVAPAPTSELVGTDWVLETLVDGEVARSVMGRSTLRLEDDGTFTATTACTTLTGRWQPTGDRIQFPEASGESRDCAPELRAQDEHELAALGSGFQATIEEDQLTALGDDGRGLVYRDAGPLPPPEEEARSEHLPGVWGMRSGTFEGEEITLPAQARGTIEFDGRRVGGTSFCNGFGGTYRLDGDRLVLEDIAVTLVGCMGDVATAELAFHGVLNAPGLSVAVDPMELVLTSEAGELRFTRVPPVPEAELVGTRWVLETVAQDGSATPAVGEPAVLELSEDGTATFSTGCQTMNGTWTAHGDSVLLADHEYDPTACGAAMAEQDSLVTQLLSGGFQVLVDGGMLTVVDTDNRGAPRLALTYRAT